MKKFALLIGTAALVFASCTKEMPGTDPNPLQDVVFTTSSQTGGLKGLKDGVDPTNCSNPDADYAWVILGTTDYYPAVFTVNDVLYTQAIKLPVGDYVLNSFALMHDTNSDTEFDINGIRTNFVDDVVVRAAPQEGSDFATFVSDPLPMAQNVSITAFAKVEIPVEVLCFEPTAYQAFGFAWFKPLETTVREMLFFGDFCTKFYLDYSTSHYGNQPGGVKVDMPAIFKIDVYRHGSGLLLKSFTNDIDPNWGVGAPVKVQYLDNPSVVDQYDFKLSILVKVGAAFEYKHFETWVVTDNIPITTQNQVGPGPDGVYDFVLGNCNALQADFSFAPYMNLPETMDINLTYPSTDSYFAMLITDFGAGFDLIPNTTEKGYCFDLDHTISTGSHNDVPVYSSLIPASFPTGSKIIGQEWDQVNWLANHLGDFTGYSWKDLQQALWILSETGSGYSGPGGHYNGEARDGIEANRPIALAMVAAAKLHGDGYIPLPGGWAAVICLVGEEVQTIFTIVDP